MNVFLEKQPETLFDITPEQSSVLYKKVHRYLNVRRDDLSDKQVDQLLVWATNVRMRDEMAYLKSQSVLKRIQKDSLICISECLTRVLRSWG